MFVHEYTFGQVWMFCPMKTVLKSPKLQKWCTRPWTVQEMVVSGVYHIQRGKKKKKVMHGDLLKPASMEAWDRKEWQKRAGNQGGLETGWVASQKDGDTSTGHWKNRREQMARGQHPEATHIMPEDLVSLQRTGELSPKHKDE